MSFRLVDEVLAAVLPDAAPSERLVLLVIAHRANEQTRECWPGMEQLCADTGMSENAVRKALTRLAKKGVPLRTNEARRGSRTIYRLPKFTPDSPDERPAYPVVKPGREAGLTGELARTTGRVSPDERPKKPGREACPKGKEQEGNRDARASARDAEPPTCPRHPHGDTGDACGRCKEVRLWHQQQPTPTPPAYQPPCDRDRCDGAWLLGAGRRPVAKCRRVTGDTCPDVAARLGAST